MTDFRYWITYTGRITVESDDSNVAAVAASDLHNERIHGGDPSYVPELEVERIEGREGE